MFAPKDYLLVEWANVRRTLQETLRFRYSESHIRDFYAECEERLQYIKKNLDVAPSNDARELHEIALSLDNLSQLIARVERSHLEEFSWPFGDALASVAKGICKESSGSLQSDPLFFFAAEGGITSYAIRPEKQQPGVIDKKIYSIIFPRSLKDHVLLHAILAHEVGHAAYETEPTAKKIKDVCDTLVSESPVASLDTMFDWCQDHIGVSERGSQGLLAYRHSSWREEFYCDLFGLILCGPSYLPAFQSMLEPMATAADADPEFVPSHPPFECRMIALVEAAKELGILYSRSANRGRFGLARSFDAAFVEKAKYLEDAGHSLLAPAQVRKATRKLRKAMSEFDNLVFPDASPELIRQLDRALERDIPPTEGLGTYGKRALGKIGLPPRIDFRHILYAGWLHWSNKQGLSRYKKADNMERLFGIVNRLCSHAIMQQQSIEYWIHNEARRSAA